MTEHLEAAKTAVLGLHLQKHMTDPASPVAQHTGFAEMVQTTNLFHNINRVLSAARETGIFIAYVKLDLSPSDYRYPLRGEFCQFVAAEHEAGEVLRPGAWGYDLHDALVCQEDESVILARQISAFSGSALDNALRTRGITDLVLTGVATNFVVTNTAWSAIDRGYSCIVLEDCCTSGSAEMHQDAINHLRPIADILMHLWQCRDASGCDQSPSANRRHLAVPQYHRRYDAIEWELRPMTEVTGDVQNHWTRRGVLARIDAVLTELGHDPQNLTPEILATVEHLHTGGLATTRDQAERITLTQDSRVLDIGCGLGGPARYLANSYGCRVDGIDLTPELIETGQVLTERCGLSDRVVLQIGDALDLPYPDEAFDVVWCQNVTMNISDKAGFLAEVYRVLRPGGLFTSTEFSVGPGGHILYPVLWAYDASISFLVSEDIMRAQFEAAGFRIRDWTNYSDVVIERNKLTAGAPPNKLVNQLVFGEDVPERQRNGQRNLIERRVIYWMITAERP